jgi:hypothetical protein
MHCYRRGQSLVEYAILLIIIIAAFVTMQVYLKRGFQGRWKDSVDQLGDQYDPGKMSGVVTHRVESTSESRLKTIHARSGDATGYYTVRVDTSNAAESKQGNMEIRY